MTIVPLDLAGFRTRVKSTTGLTDPNAIGVAPNAAHLAGGGYHVGAADIDSIGKFIPPKESHVGSTSVDYSVRLWIDRSVYPSNEASAIDIGYQWPNGGNAAWLRWNNLMVNSLIQGAPELSAVRAMNFSPDGTARKRYDTVHRDQGVIPSNDTVTIHSHVEFFRNTVGNRQAAFTYMLDLMSIAITGEPMTIDYSPATATALAIGATDKGFVDVDPTVPWDDSLRKYNLRRLVTGGETEIDISRYNLKEIVTLLDAIKTNSNPLSPDVIDAIGTAVANHVNNLPGGELTKDDVIDAVRTVLHNA